MSGAPFKRGLIEVSNLCQKDCLYCGIRRGNPSLVRYRMGRDEVLAAAAEALRRGYGAIAMQAGEIESEANTAFYEDVLRSLPRVEPKDCKLEVTLSLGEQEESVYRRWKSASGDRVLKYLLRIETSSRELYSRIHPRDCSFDRRVECLRSLKRFHYVTGSGVMIGLPGQTRDDLRRDLDFFESMQLDMVGMGPYVPDPSTPLYRAELGEWADPARRLEAALWMISEVRRRMPHVNIVAATALGVLDECGQEKGLAAGANVIMPNVTPEKYRRSYTLYPGKSSVVG